MPHRPPILTEHVLPPCPQCGVENTRGLLIHCDTGSGNDGDCISICWHCARISIFDIKARTMREPTAEETILFTDAPMLSFVIDMAVTGVKCRLAANN